MFFRQGRVPTRAIEPNGSDPGQVRTAPSSLDALTRQADNDLGAGRTDREDFLSYVWTANGSQLAGNLSGTRLNRTVVGAAGAPSAFANSGTRSQTPLSRK